MTATRVIRVFATVWCIGALAACTADGPLTGQQTATVTMRFLTPATVRSLVVQVSGPGIDPAVVVNVTVPADTVATASLTLPSGSARRFLVKAVDTAGVETHRADTTITLQPGANPNLALRLDPLASTLGITVTFGGVRLVVTDASSRNMTVGDSTVIEAYAIRPAGDTVRADSLTWGSSNPAVATVTAGRVRLIRQGAAMIAVSYRGAAVQIPINDPLAIQFGLSAYRSLLAKVYAGLAVTGQQGPAGNSDIPGFDEGQSQYWRLYFPLQTLPTDDVIITWGDQGLPELNTQTWSAENPYFFGMYSRVLFQVAMANVFLRETTGAKLTQRGVPAEARNEIAQFRAEARALRALSYWHALDLFRSVPLVTEDTLVTNPPGQYGFGDEKVSYPFGSSWVTTLRQNNLDSIVLWARNRDQATPQQLYQFIASELTAVRNALPPMGTAQYGRLDQGAVAMILAKLHLNAEAYVGTPNHAAAMQEVTAIVSSGAYTLDPSYRRLFSADNHTSPEMIFTIPQDGRRMQNWGGATFLVHAAIGGTMNAADYGVDIGWWGLRMRPETRALFPSVGPGAPDRRAAFWAELLQPTIANMGDFQQGTAAPKFTNLSSGGIAGQDLTFPDTDIPMFRLADAYLMYAELVLRGAGGSQTQALAYVNALRERAYGNASGNIAAGQMTLPFILEERARELYMEGHRRQDLIRYGLFTGADKLWAFKGGSPAGTSTASFRNVYPIPAAELSANPRLRQNTGY